MVHNLRRSRLQGWLLNLVLAFVCASYYTVGLRAAAGSVASLTSAINHSLIPTPRTEKVIPHPTSKCPPLVQQRKGIYNISMTNATSSDDTSAFHNVLLMTAVNHQFENFLLNWQMIASDYNLQWVVLSLDQTIYEKLGGEGTSLLLPESQQVQSAGKFRTPSYIKLVCNKVRMVLELLEECQVEIIFSDVDNVFLQDPFAHHLGTMIRSQQYDYIYQTNHEWTGSPANHTCITEGRAVEEGNTGFHYLRPTANMKRVLQKTLDRCDAKDNELDDQTLLWNVLREERNNTLSSWQHCLPLAATTSSEEIQPPPEGVSQFCCLDPHYYPIGKKPPKDPSVLVTLHVNYGARIRKKGKLKSWVKNGWRLPWG